MDDVRSALIGLGVVVGAVSLTLVVWYVTAFGDLWIVNGLSEPVEVRIGGEALLVGKESYLEAGSFRSGPRELVTLLDGKEIDRRTVKLGSTTNLYNVLGAGPVVIDPVVYTAHQTTEAEQQAVSHCGTDFETVRANWYFRQPPSTIELPKGSSREVRSVLRLRPGGLGACLSSLASAPLRAAELAQRAARVLPDGERLLWVAANMYAQGGEPQRALDLVAPLVAKTDDLDVHRMYHSLLRRLGRRNELLIQYRARFEAHPNSTTAYLYGRLLAPREALAALPAMLAAYPEAEVLHRLRAWSAAFEGDLEATAAECEWYHAHAGPADPMRDHWLEMEARSLVARGKAPRALELLEVALADVPEYSLRQALLLDRVAGRAHREPQVVPFKKLARAPGSNEQQLEYHYTLLLGGRTARPPTGLTDPMKTPFGPLALASESPDRALASLKATPEVGASYLSDEVAYLLLGEAWRLGDELAARRLEAVDFWGNDFSALKHYVLEGGSDELLSDLRPEERAGLMLARARVLEAARKNQEATQLVARLSKVDPLEGLAVLAARRWGPVTPAPGPIAPLRLELRDDVVLEPLLRE
jgi:hypothetical protein